MLPPTTHNLVSILRRTPLKCSQYICDYKVCNANHFDMHLFCFDFKLKWLEIEGMRGMLCRQIHQLCRLWILAEWPWNRYVKVISGWLNSMQLIRFKYDFWLFFSSFAYYKLGSSIGLTQESSSTGIDRWHIKRNGGTAILELWKTSLLYIRKSDAII